MRGKFVNGLNPFYISEYWVKGEKTTYTDVDNISPSVSNSRGIDNLNSGFKKNETLSKGSRKRILYTAAWLMIFANEKVYISKNNKKIKYRVSMITLTLCAKQMHGDKYITKKMLGNWLSNMRVNYDLRNYIWRAEKQKNGNIHYHILTDTALDYYTVLNTWNKIQLREGYVEEFRKNNTGKKYPHGVDVVRFTANNNASDYIGKYVSKNDGGGGNPVEIGGRHYSISRSLSKLDDFKKDCTDIAEMIFHHWRNRLAEVMKMNDFVSIKKINLKEFLSQEPDFYKEIKERLATHGIEPSKTINNYYKKA